MFSLYQLPKLRRTEMADMEAAVRDNSPGFFTRLGKSLSVGWYGVLEFCLQLVKLWPLWVVLLLAVASIFEILGGHRGLLPHELAEAEKIFGKSIDLSRVKIATASLPADLLNWINGDRPFTTMYIINFGRNAVIDMATAA